MAANTIPIFPLAANNSAQAFVNADGTDKKTLFTAGANGSLVRGIAATSDDTADKAVQLYATIGGTDYLIAAVTVPLNAGVTGAVPAVNLLSQGDPATPVCPWAYIDNNGNRVIWLPAAAVLKAAMQAAVTAAKTVTVTAFGADY